MTMQRTLGLFCAVSMASLIRRYMSWVIAFFFSGRRSVITRMASSSETMRCPVMKVSLKQAATAPLASHQATSYMIPEKAQIAAPVFPQKDDAMQLAGIHHLTAISAKPRENLAFYTGLLGMRLVKKTVNQDDVSAYHLFYADGKANPGTDLTFFDFPAAP